MARTTVGLEQIVREYHHVQEEHRRAGPESSARRRLEARLVTLEAHLERLLAEDVAVESDRAAWRERLHHRSEGPPVAPQTRELAFKGRSEGGAIVEIRGRPGGDFEVTIDGRPVERLAGPIDFTVYTDADRDFPEVFEASRRALAALRTWVRAPQGQPPREHVHELLADGLIDRTLGLTPRGHRAVRSAR